MAQIVVRNLEEDVRDKLRRRARQHGRSMEEEVRDILRAAVVSPEENQVGLGTRISRRFSDCHLDQAFEIPEWRGFEANPASFE